MSVNTKVNGQLVKSAGLYSVTKPIGMADIYSTEEKEVGLWIDNKPLYQRTLTIDTISSSLGVQRFAHNIANIETAFAISGTWLQKSDDSIYIGTKDIIRTDGSGNVNVGKGSVGVWVDATNIVIDTTENRSSQYVIVTIQYTKTTDTPWSGKFVPQGYGYVSSGDIYSFEERQVGVWADGKPLYQKTFDLGTLTANNNKTVLYTDVGISDVEAVVYFDVMINNQLNSNFNRPDSVTKEFYTQLVLTGIFIRAYDTAVTSAYATIQYTKTTDVAGSGEYVPSGDKAVHYSTEEEVIGTWIDGSTIYRRTITGLSIQLNGTTWVNYNPSISIDKLINVHAYYEPSGGLMTCAIAEYQYNSSVGIQLTAVQGYNRTVNTLTIEYTKTS